MTEVTLEALAEAANIEEAEEAVVEGKDIQRRGRPRIEYDMDLILAAHEAGYNAEDIVESYVQEYPTTHICAATVRSRLKEAGVTLKRGARKSEIEIEEIEDLYIKEGLTLAKTAVKLGVSVVTLRNRMEEAGIQARKRGRPNKPTDQRNVEFSAHKTLQALLGEDLEIIFTPHKGLKDLCFSEEPTDSED